MKAPPHPQRVTVFPSTNPLVVLAWRLNKWMDEMTQIPPPNKPSRSNKHGWRSLALFPTVGRLTGVRSKYSPREQTGPPRETWQSTPSFACTMRRVGVNVEHVRHKDDAACPMLRNYAQTRKVYLASRQAAIRLGGIGG